VEKRTRKNLADFEEAGNWNILHRISVKKKTKSLVPLERNRREKQEDLGGKKGNGRPLDGKERGKGQNAFFKRGAIEKETTTKGGGEKKKKKNQEENRGERKLRQFPFHIRREWGRGIRSVWAKRRNLRQILTPG